MTDLYMDTHLLDNSDEASELDKLAQQIYQQNKAIGWWDDPNRCIYQTLQLVSTEIAEATEGERKNLNDDHLPWRAMGEVELADALIRLLDVGGRYQWHHDHTTGPHRMLQRGKIKTIGGQHLVANVALAELTIAIYDNHHRDQISKAYTQVVNSVIQIAEDADYHIMAALYEKVEYNRDRADHKRENRQGKPGQKSF